MAPMEKSKNIVLLGACIFAVLVSGCSGTRIEPTLYPDEHYKKVGEAQARQDTDECNDLADKYVKDPHKYDKIARETMTGAAIGSASGALGGVIIGSNVGRATGAGAAVGAIVPLLQRLFQFNEPSPSRQRFVEYCLTNRGYMIIP